MSISQPIVLKAEIINGTLYVEVPYITDQEIRYTTTPVLYYGKFEADIISNFYRDLETHNSQLRKDNP